MDYQAGTITIFRDEEFLLMLAAAGMERWYGICPAEGDDVLQSDRSFNSSLASLYRKQVIEWDENRARVAEEYRPVFEALRDAKTCLLIRTRERPGYIKGCYFSGDKVVSIDRRTASSDELEIGLSSPDGWMDEITGSGYLPEEGIEADEMFDPDGTEGETVTGFELRSVPDGGLLKSCRIIEKGLYVILETDDGDSTVREEYSSGRAAELLKEWSGGKK